MTKTPRATDKLNIAIATISAAVSTGQGYIGALPDSEQKRALTIMVEQMEAGVSDAYAQLCAIKKAAEAI